jgi:glycosyltransferase involved in cell wall biosynthesis
VTPRVSFVVSIYNAKKHLDLFMRSIASQDYKNYEVVLVEAASTDGTREALREYAAADKRIKLIEEKFISIAAALNIGLKAATGEYVARVDADNILYPDFLSGQIDFLDKNSEIDFVIADEIKIDDENKVLGLLPFMFDDYLMKKHLLFKTVIGGAPMIGRTKSFFDIGLYEEKTIITEDRIFALKAMAAKKFASIDTVNYAYRIHAGAITRRYKKDERHNAVVAEYERKYIKKEDYLNDLEKYESLLKKELKYKDLVLKKLGNTILYCALKLADLGERDLAMTEIGKAMIVYPKNRFVYSYFGMLIVLGKKNMLATAKKFDYWIPFTIDLLQLVPGKCLRRNKKVRKIWLAEVKKYNNMLAGLNKE